jgi:replicative DNA helicase Mcm
MTQSTQLDDYTTWLKREYQDAIATLAQRYPRDQRALVLDWREIYAWEPAVADDLLVHPRQADADEPLGILDRFEEALRMVDLPADISLNDAVVRVRNLPDSATFFPGGFSPSEHADTVRAIEGEVAKATTVYSKLDRALFECQRCGSTTEVSQADDEFQDPHECSGCERQGPFRIDHDRSDHVDAQKIRIQTPPEEAQADGEDIDVYLSHDLTDVADVGDRVTVVGRVALDQQFRGSTPTNRFEPELDALHIDVEQTDADDVDISSDDRDRIGRLASGAEGDPLQLAADTLAPKIYGYDDVKRAIILALVGGARVEYEGQDFDRGELHVLLIGDPSTAKSKLVQRAEQVGWRSVGVSGKGATVAGVTATAVQDDFGDGSWALDAGAAVKANKGVLAIDEFDDMPTEVRSALYEPMANQRINVTKGGINTTLQTRVSVVAAANPEYGRFDPYEAIGEQFVFDDAMLSRFDLVYTFRDIPDKEQDKEIAAHILDARDAAKRVEQGEDPDTDAHAPAIDPGLLRSWIALAKQQPTPVFASDAVETQIIDQFTTLRGMHDYDPDDPVPVTWRSLEGITRVAEAAAKFEFSEEITERHVDIATSLVGQSMQDVGMDPETGEFDADMVETGTSKSQRDRIKTLGDVLATLQQEYDEAVPVDVILNRAEEDGLKRSKARHELDKLREKGEVYEPPDADGLRYVGGSA